MDVSPPAPEDDSTPVATAIGWVNFRLIQTLSDPSTFPLPHPLTKGEKEPKSWLENGQRWRTILSNEAYETSHNARLLAPDSCVDQFLEYQFNLLTPHEGRSQVAPYSQIRLSHIFSAYFRKFPSLFNFSLEHLPVVGFMNPTLK